MFENLDRLLRQTVHALFLILLFCLPLIFWIPNSEVFELPKMYFVYAMTTLIVGLWLMRMVLAGRIIWRRTPLDIPILLFLLSQIASTIYSIDPHVPWLGWYGRFNGGLWSTISYTLLYYAFLSNRFTIYDLRFMNKTILFSALLVACYAILQRFGIDREFWVQDVMNRVFSTQGQPNWLAGYIVMIIPFTLMLMTKSKKQKAKSGDRNNKIVFCSLFFVLLTVLLFTKSRSGLLGFAMADITFWILIFAKARPFVKRSGLNWLIIHLGILFLILATNNPVLRPSSFFPLPSPLNSQPSPTKSELGGTESGDIRRIVWTGAVELVKQRPIFGFGPETFGLTYWQVRPKEANMTSEWNFLYNKAHNEWLNLAANTGIFGLGSHLFLILWLSVWSIRQLKIRSGKLEVRRWNSKWEMRKSHVTFQYPASQFSHQTSSLTIAAILAAVVGIETINFFGFSTVTIGTYSYLFMAMAVAIESNEQKVMSNENIKRSKRPISLLSTFYFLLILFISIYLLSRVYFLFAADLQYNLGRQFYSAGYAAEALEPLSQAVNLAPNEPVFRNELAETQAMLAISLSAQDPSSLTPQDDIEPLKEAALVNFRIVSGQSKYNLIFTRTQAQMEFLMRGIDPDLTGEALLLAQKAIDLSPTDPRGYYLLGRMYGELGDKLKAQELYRQALELKPDYEEAKIALDLEFAVPASMGRVLDSSHEL